jgi:hypothetical protein
VFYSVIETRDFSLFNQSAQALLKGYFISLLYAILGNKYLHCYIDSDKTFITRSKKYVSLAIDQIIFWGNLELNF